MHERARARLMVLSVSAWLAAGVLWPVSARAYEDQLTLGLGLGYAHALPDAAPHPGALAELSASVGLDATWTARAQLSAALHPDTNALYRGLLGGELLYMFDVVELVPSFGLGVDAVATKRSPADARADFAAHAVVGLDYLLSRELSLALDVRPYVLLTQLDTEPLYLTVTVSLLLVFDR